MRRKTSKRGKIAYFAFLKKTEVVLITSFTVLLKYAVSTLPLSIYFYPSISTHKTLWLDRQDKQLLTHGTFKNACSKPVRGRFHGCGILAGSNSARGKFHGYGTLTSKKVLDKSIELTTIPLLWIAVIQTNSGAGAMSKRSA